MRQLRYAAARHDKESGSLAASGLALQRHKRAADGERRTPPRNGLQSETPCASPRWVCRAPAVIDVVIAATAIPRGTPGCATAALPSSSPAPRQYARQSVTTGEIVTRLRRTGISRRNKAGEACVPSGLRAKLLVTPVSRARRFSASGAPPTVAFLRSVRAIPAGSLGQPLEPVPRPRPSVEEGEAPLVAVDGGRCLLLSSTQCHPEEPALAAEDGFAPRPVP
jgi:hypothetical protein